MTQSVTSIIIAAAAIGLIPLGIAAAPAQARPASHRVRGDHREHPPGHFRHHRPSQDGYHDTDNTGTHADQPEPMWDLGHTPRVCTLPPP
jgi:Spy/CpxP family protein refolding chaperone